VLSERQRWRRGCRQGRRFDLGEGVSSMTRSGAGRLVGMRDPSKMIRASISSLASIYERSLGVPQGFGVPRSVDWMKKFLPILLNGALARHDEWEGDET
jgi:hypothetical protein